MTDVTHTIQELANLVQLADEAQTGPQQDAVLSRMTELFELLDDDQRGSIWRENLIRAKTNILALIGHGDLCRQGRPQHKSWASDAVKRLRNQLVK